MTEDWSAWPKEKLEQEYSPSSCIEDISVFITAYIERSAAVKQSQAHIPDLSYGMSGAERLDFFPPTTSGDQPTPLMVFIHGGYWQELSKNESCFAAPGFTDSGNAFAALDYTLAPFAGIGDMVDECCRALAWLHKQAIKLGVDPEQIHISGSSAGAHLCAMLLVADWADYGLDRSPICTATLLSGVYDLRPLVNTYVNEPLKLTEKEAVKQSPAFMLRSELPRVLIAWGENETSEFKRQSQEFADAYAGFGNSVSSLEVPEANHFDIVFQMTGPNGPLARRINTLLTTEQ